MVPAHCIVAQSVKQVQVIKLSDVKAKLDFSTMKQFDSSLHSLKGKFEGGTSLRVRAVEEDPRRLGLPRGGT